MADGNNRGNWWRAGILALVLLPAALRGEVADSSVEAMTFAKLGCRNCHGRAGDGGKGKPGGPIIAQPRQPLRRFISAVRLPYNMMPFTTNEFAPDAELALLYQWLEGAEAVKIPAPVNIDLRKVSDPKAEPSAPLQLELTAAGAGDLSSLGYRVSLITNGQAPVANQAMEYRRANQEWATVATDAQGEALLDSRSAFVTPDVKDRGKVRARLRMKSPAARTVVVVEALDASDPARTQIVGIGTALIK